MHFTVAKVAVTAAKAKASDSYIAQLQGNLTSLALQSSKW